MNFDSSNDTRIKTFQIIIDTENYVEKTGATDSSKLNTLNWRKNPTPQQKTQNVYIEKSLSELRD